MSTPLSHADPEVVELSRRLLDLSQRPTGEGVALMYTRLAQLGATLKTLKYVASSLALTDGLVFDAGDQMECPFTHAGLCHVRAMPRRVHIALALHDATCPYRLAVEWAKGVV